MSTFVILSRKRKLPPMFIIPLVLLIVLLLTSITAYNEAFLVVSSAVWLALLGLGPERVNKLVNKNIARLKGESRTEMAIAYRSWPKYWLRWATRFSMLASVLFILEYVVDFLSSNGVLPPSVSGLCAWLGLAVFALALIQTYRIGEYLQNPKYNPRFRITDWGLISCIVVLDFCYSELTTSFLAYWTTTLTLFGKLLTGSCVLAIIASALFIVRFSGVSKVRLSLVLLAILAPVFMLILGSLVFALLGAFR